MVEYDDIILDCYMELRNAIIAQAARDYASAYYYYILCKREEWRALHDECLYFFRSHWFAGLCDADYTAITHRFRNRIPAFIQQSRKAASKRLVSASRAREARIFSCPICDGDVFGMYGFYSELPPSKAKAKRKLKHGYIYRCAGCDFKIGIEMERENTNDKQETDQ